MDSKKIKILAAVIVVAVIGLMGYSKVKESLQKDPVITGLQAEFIGTVGPGKSLTKSMFLVKGVTESGKLEEIHDFSSKITKTTTNGASCEIELEAQGYTTTVIVDITREPVFEEQIGYPDEDTAKVTCYSNGDLEFTGVGAITNFTKKVPWADYEYTHVYIDETLEIESMDYWFEGNEELVYCSPLPKTVKTIKHTFAGCIALKQTPAIFQCADLKIMDYAFSGCTELTEIDVIPVNVSSIQYTFENCTKLLQPADMSKTSNLVKADGIHAGCTNLREAAEIPESVITMNESYKDCINIKAAVAFPPNVQTIASAYSGDSALQTGATIPESVIDLTNCFYGCSALHGELVINTDASSYSGAVKEANTNGDKLELSGRSGNLLAIQKDANNSSTVLKDAEAAAKENERMISEQGGGY